MILNRINLNHLRLFESVYRTRSMTEAAKENHLTQSGISQHMKSLEDTLEMKLFDRIRQKIVPTQAANKLHEMCAVELHTMEEALLALKGQSRALTGTLSIGIPYEFGNNVIMPLVSRILKQNAEIQINITYGYAYEMNTQILNGDLDFAFVDSFGFDQRITTKEIYRETLILCASQTYLSTFSKIQESKSFFESLDYIDYLSGEPVLHMWFQHHFPRKHFHLNTRATVSGVSGVAKLITEGTGVGVLPLHHIRKLQHKADDFYLFKGKNKPLQNIISVAYLREKTHSHTVRHILEWFIQTLQLPK